VKLLIIDDHPVVREGLAAVLRQAEPDLEILQASGRAEGLELAAANPGLDMVFLDLKIPDAEGVSAIAEFGRRCPQLPLIVISSSESPADVRESLAAGALGYVPKSAAPHTMVGAMKLVLAGEIYIPPLMLGSEPAPASPRLTDRQLGVLRQVCDGASNKQIARRLGLSEKTVKAHVTAILRELGAANRTQAARAASTAGLIPPSAA
jgi:DNA-binding NarL/FixJ family response regulator